MNIVSLFNSFVNYFDEFLGNSSIALHDLESKINDSTYQLNLDTLKWILEYIDLDYKSSMMRKELYYVQGSRQRTLITSLGLLTFNKTYYKSKKKINGKYEFFSYLEDYLGIDKWAKMTLKAETNLINNATSNGMSWAANNTIPNHIVSRQTISVKIKNINYNYIEDIQRVNVTPQTLYIEADEVHSNLQSKTDKKKKNKIVPVTLTHEGHKEDFVNKKQLKNKHYIASSILKTNLLWNETYKYLDTKYDLTQVKHLFITGDGAPWIKQFNECFSNAIFVLDKFHYRKSLNYIFKRDPILTKLADDYLRNKMVDEFKALVKLQIEKYPNQTKYMNKEKKYLLNNIDGIINQHHPSYKCPASMEGHISNVYARKLTSRPHSYSLDGLENTVQLITMKANNILLTEQLYHRFKYGNSTYQQLNLEKFISNFRNQANEFTLPNNKYLDSYSIDNSNFNNLDNYRLDYFLNHRL